ncbi:uncharacterized protein VP01_1783g1 [Puccinia sorghi]|uniref:Uncharacterized protein n=1 Tax=Puccinia sorghi TaxID=27349 RepID=A0A0L6VF51_9BASI|nr:uncharacterized protein VP01_1783g1 [Puccinia sorghi]
MFCAPFFFLHAIIILSHLVENLPRHPISVKIRLLPSQEDTLSLVEKICGTGVSLCMQIEN